MKKIGISLLTLFVVATAACAESPTSSAAGADGSLNGNPGLLGTGHFVDGNPGLLGSGHVAVASEEETVTEAAAEVERNPGLLGSGH